MNEKLYACVKELDEAKYRGDSGLFFGSIHATLNHLLVVDRLWTGRVQGIDRGVRSLNQVLYDDLPALHAGRRQEDADMIALMDRLTEADLQSYKRYWTADRTKQVETKVWDMLTGMFNHQTHHRGQIYAVLLQAGLKLPDIDVIYYLVDSDQARYVELRGRSSAFAPCMVMTADFAAA